MQIKNTRGETDMLLNDLLQQWQINVPKNVYLFEYLLESKKSNCFFIDRLPLTVSKENSKLIRNYDNE